MPSGTKITSLTFYLNTSITLLQFSLTTTSPLKPCRKTAKNGILYHPRAASPETQKWAILHLFDFSRLNLSILINPCTFSVLCKEGKSDLQVIIISHVYPFPSAFNCAWPGLGASQPTITFMRNSEAAVNSWSEIVTSVLKQLSSI